MKRTIQNCGRSFRQIGFVFGMLAIALSWAVDQAAAQSSAQYEIGESSRLLRASIDYQEGNITEQEFKDIQMVETCKNPAQRLQDRNRPWMSVWNTSTTPDEITSVTIDLKEEGFEFGDGDVLGDGFEGILSMLSFRSDGGVDLDSVEYGSDKTELVLNFTGLTEGLAAIFRVDIDEPGGFLPFPDFRESMLGADTGDGPGDVAMITTEFGSGASSMLTFEQSGPLSHSGIAERYHGQTMSMIETSVPEPTSLVLFGLGLSGIAVIRRRR